MTIETAFGDHKRYPCVLRPRSKKLSLIDNKEQKVWKTNPVWLVCCNPSEIPLANTLAEKLRGWGWNHVQIEERS